MATQDLLFAISDIAEDDLVPYPAMSPTKNVVVAVRRRSNELWSDDNTNNNTNNNTFNTANRNNNSPSHRGGLFDVINPFSGPLSSGRPDQSLSSAPPSGIINTAPPSAFNSTSTSPATIPKAIHVHVPRANSIGGFASSGRVSPTAGTVTFRTSVKASQFNSETPFGSSGVATYNPHASGNSVHSPLGVGSSPVMARSPQIKKAFQFPRPVIEDEDNNVLELVELDKHNRSNRKDREDGHASSTNTNSNNRLLYASQSHNSRHNGSLNILDLHGVERVATPDTESITEATGIADRSPAAMVEMGGTLTNNPLKSPQQRVGPRGFTWRMVKPIGSGGFGTVYLGFVVELGKPVVNKQIDLKKYKVEKRQEVVDGIMNEIRLMREMDHPNIVKYIRSRSAKGFINIFMEYIPGGSLRSLLDSQDVGQFTLPVTARYVRFILEGLTYLHDKKIIHRDIKAANVLLTLTGEVKLADFGSAQTLQQADGFVGTVNWMPPEVVKKDVITEKVDIWSLGCTVMEMLTGRYPFHDLMDKETPLAVFNFIRSAKEPLPIPSEITDPVARNFIDICLRVNPRDRPSTLELKAHPFLSYVDEVDYDNVSIADSMYSLMRPETRMSIAPSLAHSILSGPHDPEAEQHVQAIRKNLRRFVAPPGLPLGPTRMDSSVVLVAGNRIQGDGGGLQTYNPNASSIHRLNPNSPNAVTAMSSSTLSSASMKFAPFTKSTNTPAVVIKASSHAKTISSEVMIHSDGDNRTAFSDGGDGQSPITGNIYLGIPSPHHPGLGYAHNPLAAPPSHSPPNSQSNPNSSHTNTNSGGSVNSAVGTEQVLSGVVTSSSNGMFPLPQGTGLGVGRAPSPTMTTASRAMTALYFNDPEADELLAAIQLLGTTTKGGKGGGISKREKENKGLNATSTNARFLGDSDDEADIVQEISTNKNRLHKNSPPMVEDAPSEIEVSDSDESDIDNSYATNSNIMDAMSMRTTKSSRRRGGGKGRCTRRLVCQISVGIGAVVLVAAVIVILVVLV